MKKVFRTIFVIFLSVFVFLSGLLVYSAFFKTSSYNYNELITVCDNCYTEICSIVDEQGLSMRTIVNEPKADFKKAYITVNDNEVIEVDFTDNEYFNGIKRVGYFSVCYTITNATENTPMNIDLFVDLVNSCSGQKITTDFVSDFLKAPEEEYSPQKYGLEKNYSVEKMLFLDFFENWNINYKMTENGYAELCFWGCIK